MAKEPKPIARAFPGHTNPRPGLLVDADPGMTLRQWYAGQALAGISAACPELGTDEVASQALQTADDLIAAETAADGDGLPIAAGRLCREVLIMCDRLESGRGNFNGGDLVAIAAAWRSLVQQCADAGALMERRPTDGKA